jgi:putative transposase
MVGTEQIQIVRHMIVQDLLDQIRRLEKDTVVIQRLFFIKHGYDGESVEEAASLVGAGKNTGCLW